MAKLNKLTPLQVQKTKKLGWMSDGGGLYLRVRKSGTKTWMFRYEKMGKKRDLTLGPQNVISLSKARDMSSQCRLAIVDGKPVESVFASKEMPKTFLDAAYAIVERRKKSWKSDKTAIRWRRGLMDHAKPLHMIPVSEISIQDVEGILAPIWFTQNHSARMVRGMIEQALDLATVLGWRSGDNPARWKGRLEYLLPDYAPKVKHHAAMPYKDTPKFFRGLIEGSANVTRNALGLTILTASRGHMVRHATWSEFDLKERIWTIPADRMKKSDEAHIIPLTDHMMELLPERNTGLVFPYRGKGFSENAFRSTFKDWASDCTDFADEVSEQALAHKVGSSVRRAYRRGLGLERRRELLIEWGDFLCG